MRISTLFYTLKQGISSVFRNKWFTLASLATIGACLFLFGIFFSIVINVEHVVETAEEGVSVTVFFDEGISAERIAEIGDMIGKRTEVSKTEFISAEQAWETFSVEYLGEYADGFQENPLADSANYRIYLRDVSLQSALVTYLENIPGVRTVNKSEDIANTLAGVKILISYISVGIIGILLAVSIFLISNTVTIGISIRKEEIAIMKYIGATDFFVESPFIYEGVIIGLIGSLIPLGLIYYIYNIAVRYITEEFPLLVNRFSFVPLEQVFHYLAPVSLAIGIGIGLLGSVFTVRKHLHA